MPKVIKKKATKKKVVKEDDVKSAAFQALDVIKERQKEVIIGVAVIATIVILFIIFSLYSTSQYKKASTLQSNANNYYYGLTDAEAPEDQRLKKAIDLYKQSLEIKATPIALFYLGNSYFKMGNFENAKTEYNRFINDFSGDELILPLVYQKLASAHFKTNENDKALDAVRKLSTLNKGIFRDTALILEARYYDSIGDADKATALYQEIVATFQSSPWSAEAASKIVTATKETVEGEAPASDVKETEKIEASTAEKSEGTAVEIPAAEKSE